jgi:hypothetical protein
LKEAIIRKILSHAQIEEERVDDKNVIHVVHLA